jgi:dolichol-phosphate mannosyltransferase
MKIVVINPTYNERDNIRQLVPDVQRQFARMDHDCHILVVDDASPDGTASVVRDLQNSYHNLHLLNGRKTGLGAAYIRGMRHAVNVLGADVVFEMDADYSHKPSDIPLLMNAIESGADFAIGSRYIAGGTIPREWGWHRRLNSLVGNLVARYVAGIRRVHDCTAGFRAIRTTTLKKIDFSNLRVQGYAFQVALLHAAVSAGATVREIPVDFIERTRGESKLGIRDIVEFVINAWWIRFHSSKTFIKFGIVGLSGVAVNLGMFTLLVSLGLNKYLASPAAVEISIISNFVLNNYWTFRWRRTKERIRIRGLKFHAVALVGMTVSFSTFVLLSLFFPRTSPQVHQLVAIAPAMLVNYFLNSYWTFRSNPGSSGGAVAPATTSLPMPSTRAEDVDSG